MRVRRRDCRRCREQTLRIVRATCLFAQRGLAIPGVVGLTNVGETSAFCKSAGVTRGVAHAPRHYATWPFDLARSYANRARYTLVQARNIAYIHTYTAAYRWVLAILWIGFHKILHVNNDVEAPIDLPRNFMKKNNIDSLAFDCAIR